MKTFLKDIDALKDLKSTIERYSSNGLEALWSIESVIQSRLNELKSQESCFTSQIQEAEDNLSNAERALRTCEAQVFNDGEEDEDTEPDCREYESEVYDCRKHLDEVQQKYDTYKHEIGKLESEIDYYQNAKVRFQSSLEYLQDTTVTRLLTIISKLEEYFSYTLMPSFYSNNATTTTSDVSSNKLNYTYKEFKDDKVAYEWGYSERSWGKLWTDSLPKEQKESLNRYKQLGYSNINEYLRKGDKSRASEQSQFHFNLMKDDIQNIDIALNSSIIPENVIAYRGYGLEGNIDFECSVGHVITEKAYESTSLSYSSALHFANKVANSENKVIAKIYIPKGKKGAFMEGISNIKEDGNEILLPRNTKYEVLSVKYINGIKHLELKVI
jgi:predicted  nucleic acid-binding Zn-ribbon protein